MLLFLIIFWGVNLQLLERNPAVRLGCGRNDATDIKNHPFFKNVNWEMVLNRKVKPPDI